MTRNEVKPLYLTCTASQAQEFNTTAPHGLVSLNELLELRAQTHGDVRLAGFPERANDKTTWILMEFSRFLSALLRI